jgi:hypothetical protein
MSRGKGLLLILAGILLLLTAIGGRGENWRRALGPLRTLIGAVEWMRMDQSLREGESVRAYQHAEDALRWLDRDSGVWIFYAHSLLFHEARSTRTLTPMEREAYCRAGLDVLERAQAVLPNPGDVLLYEGAVWAGWAELPEELRPLPASPAEAWRAAARCFARAEAAGNPQAAHLRQAAEEHFSHAEGSGR